MVEQIQMSFVMWTRVGQGNHVLDGSPDPAREGKERGRPFVNYRNSLP